VEIIGQIWRFIDIHSSARITNPAQFSVSNYGKLNNMQRAPMFDFAFGENIYSVTINQPERTRSDSLITTKVCHKSDASALRGTSRRHIIKPNPDN
jgi:hypothetical protein